jgi:hypothetical protein
MSGEGVMCQFVMVRGHGNELIDKWFKTGFLDDIEPEQCLEAAQFFHRVALEIIASDPKKGTPEYELLEKLCDIVLPVAHDLFKKSYPHIPDPKWVMKECEKFFDGNQGLYEGLKSYDITLTAEQEFGALCLDQLVTTLSYERNPIGTNQAIK